MDTPKTPEELIRKISEADQLASSIIGTAKTMATMFKSLQEEGMTRIEAFEMTRAWIVAATSRTQLDTKR